MYVLLLQVYPCKIWGKVLKKGEISACAYVIHKKQTLSKWWKKESNHYAKADGVLVPVIYGAQWRPRALHWPAQPYMITSLLSDFIKQSSSPNPPPLFPPFLQFSPPTLITIQHVNYSVPCGMGAGVGALYLPLIPVLQMLFLGSFHGGNSLNWCHIIQISAQLSTSQNLLCCLKWHLSVPFLVRVTL